MECNEIGKRIAELRTERGINQSVLAKAMFVRRETVAQWEAGTRDIKTEYTIRLANYFNVTSDYLLGISKTRSRDIKIQAVCDYTGLPEAALVPLREHSDTISKIIMKREFPELAHKLSQLTDFESLNKAESDNIIKAIKTQLGGGAYPIVSFRDAIEYRINVLFEKIVEEIVEEAAQNGKT